MKLASIQDLCLHFLTALQNRRLVWARIFARFQNCGKSHRSSSKIRHWANSCSWAQLSPRRKFFSTHTNYQRRNLSIQRHCPYLLLYKSFKSFSLPKKFSIMLRLPWISDANQLDLTRSQFNTCNFGHCVGVSHDQAVAESGFTDPRWRRYACPDKWFMHSRFHKHIPNFVFLRFCSHVFQFKRFLNSTLSIKLRELIIKIDKKNLNNLCIYRHIDKGF